MIIDRYDVYSSTETVIFVDKDSNGDYVYYKDVEKIVSELAEARAKLAAVESSEPIGFIDANGDAILSVDGLRGGYLYRGPLPADKPAVAVDEKTNARGEPEAIYLQLHDPEESDTLNVADYKADVTWCWHKINGNDVRYIREDLAAPSHSQQSAGGIEYSILYEFATENKCSYNKLCAAVNQAISANNHVEQQLLGRCPSHESEQP